MEFITPEGPWARGRQNLSMRSESRGRPNLGLGAVDTENQLLFAAVDLFTFALLTDKSVPHNYYAVMGHMTHGVSRPSGHDPARNIVSVGYYARDLTLDVELLSDGRMWDAGPVSTVGTHSVGFNVGGSLGFFGPIPTGHASSGFSASFSAPDVSIRAMRRDRGIRWEVALPRVGHVSPGVPANPGEASFAGYTWPFACVFEAPKTTGKFGFRIRGTSQWQFDWPRGTRNHTVDWNETRDVWPAFSAPVPA